jgi:hypothetical protein
MTHNDLLLEIVCYKELTNSVYIWHKVLGMFQITGYAVYTAFAGRKNN